MLKKIYKRGRKKKKLYNERISKIIEDKSRITSREATMTGFRNAIFGPKFWKASWICAILISCSQLSGIGLVTIYVYSMLGKIAVETDGKFPISPVLGSFLVNLSNLVFAILLSPIVPKFGRKPFALIGCFGMLICNISAGACL